MVKELKRNGFLLREGGVWKYYAFVIRGCLRTYTIDDRGVERVVSFVGENWRIPHHMIASYLGVTPRHNCSINRWGKSLLPAYNSVADIGIGL